MERGYVKLWRKCLDSGLLQNGPAWQLFGYLLLKATHRPHRRIVGGAIFDLQPGEAIFGRVKAAADLGLGEKQIRSAFDLLKRLEIVSGRATNRCTVVSFVNWQRYQDEGPALGQRAGQPQGQREAAQGPAGGRRRATNKNGRTEEERKTDTSYLARSDAGASSPPGPAGTVWRNAMSRDAPQERTGEGPWAEEGNGTGPVDGAEGRNGAGEAEARKRSHRSPEDGPEGRSEKGLSEARARDGCPGAEARGKHGTVPGDGARKDGKGRKAAAWEPNGRSPEDGAAPGERPAAFIPLADGSDFAVPASLAGEYAAAYPGVDVSRELAQARAWCLSNPRQRKTKNGVRRFLNAWLDRAQNRISRASPGGARTGLSRQGHFDDAGARREYRGDNDAIPWA